jgi:ribosome-binding protein aMBF1 (putative translation factor)
MFPRYYQKFAKSCKNRASRLSVCAIVHIITPMIEPAAPILARIAQVVRDERRRQQMDQRTLALVAEVAVRSVHRIENGGATVRLDVLMKVLTALGLELDVRPRVDP